MRLGEGRVRRRGGAWKCCARKSCVYQWLVQLWRRGGEEDKAGQPPSSCRGGVSSVRRAPLSRRDGLTHARWRRLPRWPQLRRTLIHHWLRLLKGGRGVRLHSLVLHLLRDLLHCLLLCLACLLDFHHLLCDLIGLLHEGHLLVIWHQLRWRLRWQRVRQRDFERSLPLRSPRSELVVTHVGLPPHPLQQLDVAPVGPHCIPAMSGWQADLFERRLHPASIFARVDVKGVEVAQLEPAVKKLSAAGGSEIRLEGAESAARGRVLPRLRSRRGYILLVKVVLATGIREPVLLLTLEAVARREAGLRRLRKEERGVRSRSARAARC